VYNKQQLKETKLNNSSTRSDVTNQISCDKNIENRKIANADYVNVSTTINICRKCCEKLGGVIVTIK